MDDQENANNSPVKDIMAEEEDYSDEEYDANGACDAEELVQTRRRYLATVAGIGGLALAGCLEEEETTSASSDDNGGDNGGENDNGGGNQGLVIENHELVQDSFTMQIEGTLLNDTGEEQLYVEVRATVYNENDVRVDDFFTNTTDLAQGEKWAFEVLITADSDEVDRYELEASTGF